ncbi:MAG: aminotransferase class III-fold pyridoxal phosphate-dependent enzyme, partial [Bacillota bacterium]
MIHGTGDRIVNLETRLSSGVYRKRGVVIVRGAGARVWDSEGREYVDCNAGHGVAIVGHCNEYVVRAVSEQAARLITCSETFCNDVRAELLSQLARVTPGDMGRFFLCNSGTEAVEAALKFARFATGRTGVVAAMRGFHGRSMGSLSATWESKYRTPFEPLVPGF